MSVLISGLLLAAAAQEDGATAKTLSTDFVTKASTKKLAKAVLPPETAAKVIGHKLIPPHLHWLEGYPVRFWGKATVLVPGFRQRSTYYVSMPQQPKGTLTPGKPRADIQIKMADDCATATDPFIHLNGTQPAMAVKVLQWLLEASRAARGKAELRADVECRTYRHPSPCARGARQVLAELPLENTNIVERIVYGEDDWRVSVQPQDAPNSYWQVSISRLETDGPRVRISWDIIPPF